MATGTLQLTKHDAAGNDFLVMVDLENRRPLSAAEARLLCDPHHGIGADGILRAVAGTAGTDLSMELRNADGSVAEMSGNGIRCLVQAVVDAGVLDAGTVSVATLGGTRRVDYQRGELPGMGFARVEMGEARLGAELAPEDAGGRRGRAVDMGNPHVVLFGPPALDGDLATTGRRLAEQAAAGANVEFVWSGADVDELFMRVWERGVGETLACGTGTCAAAAALHDWGVVGATVAVHNRGGTLEVEIGPRGVVLAGPTRRVGRVEVDEELLATASLVSAGEVAIIR